VARIKNVFSHLWVRRCLL